MPLRVPLTLLLLAGVCFGLVFSPPVLSIGLIGLMVLSVLDPVRGLNPRWRTRAPRFFRSSLFWALVSLYGLLLIGAWQTYDWPYYLERLRIKLPLLLLPFAWPGLPALSARQRDGIYAGFALFIGLVLAGVLVNYALHAEAVNRAIGEGRAVPVPRNHIRFSLLVAVALLAALRCGRLRAPGRRRAWWGLTAFLFVGAHLLAVRSGLVACYGGLLAYLGADALTRGNYRTLYIGLVLTLLLPPLAYATVPSLRAKVDYARYELLHRPADSDDGGRYSDNERLRSMAVGLDVWRQHRLLGVGPGNLRAATDEYYGWRFGQKKGHRPHNQFVSALAGSGLLGYWVTLTAFLLIGLGEGRWRQPAFVGVWTVFLLSCLVENTLETSAGVSMFCFFVLLFATIPSPSAGRLPSPSAPASRPA